MVASANGISCSTASLQQALLTWREGIPAPYWEVCYNSFRSWRDSGFARPPRPSPPSNHFKFDPRWGATNGLHPRKKHGRTLGPRTYLQAGIGTDCSEQLPSSIDLSAAKLVLLGDSYTELHWIGLACAMHADLRVRSRRVGVFAGTSVNRGNISIPYMCVPAANGSLCLLSHKKALVQAEDDNASASLGSMMAIGRSSGWLTARDVVVANAGLHYHSSDQLFVAASELLVAHRAAGSTKPPRLIWRETSVQSFPTPSGMYIHNSSSTGLNCKAPPMGQDARNKVTTPMMEASHVPILRYEHASQECWQESYGWRDTQRVGVAWGQRVPGQRSQVVLDCTHTALPSGLIDWLSVLTLRMLHPWPLRFQG